MFSALRVREVGAVVLVDGQTEPAFERAEMVPEDVWVLVEIDGFKGELAEPFASVGVGGRVGGDTAASELAAGTVLSFVRERKMMLTWVALSILCKFIEKYAEECWQKD